MSPRYCFIVYSEEDTDNLFGIVKKSFWDKNQAIEDASFGLNRPPNLPDEFAEVQESMFQYHGDLETGRTALINAGFIEVKE